MPIVCSHGCYHNLAFRNGDLRYHLAGGSDDGFRQWYDVILGGQTFQLVRNGMEAERLLLVEVSEPSICSGNLSYFDTCL